MQQYLVVPDQHGRNKWQGPAKEHLAAGKPIICLGDYFDSFNLSDQDILDNFIDNILLKEQYPELVTLLLGNHDFPYLNSMWSCSGNRQSQWFALNSLLKQHLHLFQLAHQVKDTLFVHAGLTTDWLKYNRILIERQLGETIEEYITRWNYADLLNHLFLSVERPLLWQVSRVHGGWEAYDSPIWVRPSQLLNSLPENLKQVVGHTTMREVTTLDGGAITFTDCMESKNWQPLILEI